MDRQIGANPAPALARWWNAQDKATKVVAVVAGLFVLGTMINLMSLGASRSTLSDSIPVVSRPAAVPEVTLVQESAPAAAGRAWVATKVWQGGGNRDTEAFTVVDHWRVDWIFSTTQVGANFQVTIHRAEGRALIAVAASTLKAGTDTSFWVGPGTYFLRVNSHGGDWKIAVQDLR